MENLSVTHVLNDDKTNSVCNKAQIGDQGITLDQAHDPNNNLSFDCAACYKALTGEDPI